MSWIPPPTVQDHAGITLHAEMDFFADPPPQIGEILSATSSLRTGTRPRPRTSWAVFAGLSAAATASAAALIAESASGSGLALLIFLACAVVSVVGGIHYLMRTDSFSTEGRLSLHPPDMAPRSFQVQFHIPSGCGTFLAACAMLGGLASIANSFEKEPDWIQAIPSFVVVVGLAAAVGWHHSRFQHQCSYVGRKGVAEFVCQDNRENSRCTILNFCEATALRETETLQRVNGIYQGTDYSFTWTNADGVVVAAIAGRHQAGEGDPPPRHSYHMAASAKGAWNMYLLAIRQSVDLSEEDRYLPGNDSTGDLPDLHLALPPQPPTENSGEDRIQDLRSMEISFSSLTFSGHTDLVRSVAISPDGHLVLSGSGDKTVRLWDAQKGQELKRFGGHTGGVCSVAWSPDGRLALSGSYDRTVLLRDVATGKTLLTFEGHTGGIYAVAFTRDGRFALSGSEDKTLRLWDVATGKALRTFEGHKSAVDCVALSPDGHFAISGSANKAVTLWDLETGKPVRGFEGHAERVLGVAFSPDGRFALTGSGDQTLRFWEVETGRTLRTFEGHSGRVNSVAFSPDGRFAVSGSMDKTLRLWNVETGDTMRRFEGHTDPVTSVCFHPDGRSVLSGSADKTLRSWGVDERS